MFFGTCYFLLMPFHVMRSSLLGGLLLASSCLLAADSPTWWSLRPLERPKVPEIAGNQRASNPIDYFLLARLEAAGLSFSPEADRRTLIRRVYFDLIGLPPTPEAVQQFVNDPDPRAYERLVTDLLDRLQYGERWARHWLD